VRVRGDLITRVMGEHVVDQKLFEEVWRRQLHNPAAFWRPYPFPSIATDDPFFVRPIPRNSWGGASHVLTALRTPRWMEHYGEQAEFVHLMTQWVGALVRSGEFLQQMDPDTGEFSPDRGAYSPAMLTLFDFTWRLYGVRPEGDTLQWNCRLPEGTAAVTAVWGAAKLETDRNGSTLTLAGKRIAHVRETGRVVTKIADPTRNAALARGRTFLAKFQLSDGSWPETTRPSGFVSYAERISTAGWAAYALLSTDPERH
jgi:hypothetical protein